MKRYLLTLLVIAILGIMLPQGQAFAQCVPADSTECPDPENNGEICPDTLAPGYLGQFYSQVATILPPLTYGDTIVVTLHHITLVAVDSLPNGITWQSNAPNNEFMAGEYYCILLEGTPDTIGTFPLRIVVDVYIIILPGFPPVYAGQIIDSTSLVMEVFDPSGISQPGPVTVTGVIPNPFRQETSISFTNGRSEVVSFEVYDLTGHRIFDEQLPATPGENTYIFRNPGLRPGHYIYVIRSAGARVGGAMVISN